MVLYFKTYIFNFLDQTLIDCLDTSDNNSGLCELAMAPSSGFMPKKPPATAIENLPKSYIEELEGFMHPCTVIAALAETKGQIRLRKLRDNSTEYVLPCHNEPLSALRLSRDGDIIVTACDPGIYIRVWGWTECK